MYKGLLDLNAGCNKFLLLVPTYLTATRMSNFWNWRLIAQMIYASKPCGLRAPRLSTARNEIYPQQRAESALLARMLWCSFVGSASRNQRDTVTRFAVPSAVRNWLELGEATAPYRPGFYVSVLEVKDEEETQVNTTREVLSVLQCSNTPQAQGHSLLREIDWNIIRFFRALQFCNWWMRHFNFLFARGFCAGLTTHLFK